MDYYHPFCYLSGAQISWITCCDDVTVSGSITGHQYEICCLFLLFFLSMGEYTCVMWVLGWRPCPEAEDLHRSQWGWITAPTWSTGPQGWLGFCSLRASTLRLLPLALQFASSSSCIWGSLSVTLGGGWEGGRWDEEIHSVVIKLPQGVQ